MNSTTIARGAFQSSFGCPWKIGTERDVERERDEEREWKCFLSVGGREVVCRGSMGNISVCDLFTWDLAHGLPVKPACANVMNCLNLCTPALATKKKIVIKINSITYISLIN